MNITYLKVILSLITILILIHNENTYQSHPPTKQNKVHNITNPNPNNIYHLNDPNTKVPITNTPLPNKNKKRNNKEPIH